MHQHILLLLLSKLLLRDLWVEAEGIGGSLGRGTSSELVCIKHELRIVVYESLRGIVIIILKTLILICEMMSRSECINSNIVISWP